MEKVLKRIKKIVLGIYRDIYKYIYFVPFDLKPIELGEKDWCKSVKIIPHAMGEIEGYTYTNSLEALINAIEKGFYTLEVDACVTSDGKPVCGHDLPEYTDYETFMNTKIYGKFTPMDFDMLIEYIRSNENVCVLLDMKENEEIIVNYLKQNASDIIDRFIVQVAKISDYKRISKIHKFKYFHYNFTVDGNVNYHLGFVVRNKIRTCSVPIKNIKNEKTLRYLRKFNVKPYAYTINDSELCKIMISRGCYGIITDNLDLKIEN